MNLTSCYVGSIVTSENDLIGPLSVGFLIHDPRLADRYLARVEATLKSIAEVKPINITSTSDPKLAHCSIVVVFANNLDEEQMITWVKGIPKRLSSTSINIPWLIICENSEGIQREMLRYALAENWYFDLVLPDHLDSLMTRIANLIRISDHISELRRYETETKLLEEKVAAALEMLDEIKRAQKS
jgi:hypothetical protein